LQKTKNKAWFLQRKARREREKRENYGFETVRVVEVNE
jgi:hypothetical protein